MFTIKMIPKDKLFTRRGILSVTSSIYNPLTMVSPITLQAEKLPQDLCKQGLIWDERIRRDKSQFLENESDVTRRILVKIRQPNIFVYLGIRLNVHPGCGVQRVVFSFSIRSCFFVFFALH